MTRYVVHIGPHKTGTSYLQESFTRLQPLLAARGICYPDTWGNARGHHLIGERLARGELDVLQQEFDDLAATTSCHTVLLSSETLAHCGEAKVPVLRQLLRGADTTIVFYFRRWSELVPSLWREIVKHGSLDALPEFVLKCLQNPPEMDIVNFGIVLDRYASAFGINNLRTASYNALLEDGQDLLTHFCANFLDWPDPPPTGLGRVNASLDMVDTEIIRALNALEWTRARDDRRRLFQRYLDLKETLPVRWLIEQAMQYTVNRVRIDDLASGLAQLHDDIAHRYRGTLVPPCPRGRLFDPRLSDTDYIRAEYLMHPGVMDVMRDIQAKLLA